MKLGNNLSLVQAVVSHAVLVKFIVKYSNKYNHITGFVLNMFMLIISKNNRFKVNSKRYGTTPQASMVIP